MISPDECILFLAFFDFVLLLRSTQDGVGGVVGCHEHSRFLPWRICLYLWQKKKKKKKNFFDKSADLVVTVVTVFTIQKKREEEKTLKIK